MDEEYYVDTVSFFTSLHAGHDAAGAPRAAPVQQKRVKEGTAYFQAVRRGLMARMRQYEPLKPYATKRVRAIPNPKRCPYDARTMPVSCFQSLERSDVKVPGCAPVTVGSGKPMISFLSTVLRLAPDQTVLRT